MPAATNPPTSFLKERRCELTPISTTNTIGTSFFSKLTVTVVVARI
jgi:hypothetical protein